MRHLYKRLIAALAALMVVFSLMNTVLPNTTWAQSAPKTLEECAPRLTTCEKELDKANRGLGNCEDFVRKNCDWNKYQEYKKNAADTKPPPKKTFVMPKCMEEKVIEGQAATPVPGYKGKVCVTPYEDFSNLVKQVESMKGVCTEEKIYLTRAEEDRLRKRDPETLAQIRELNAKAEECFNMRLFILTLKVKLEESDGQIVALEEELQNLLEEWKAKWKSMWAALHGLCDPEEGQKLTDACIAFRVNVQSRLTDNEGNIKALQESDKRQWDEIHKLQKSGTHVQLGGTGGYLFRPGGGPGTGIVAGRVNLIEKFSPNWGVLLGAQLGAGFSEKEQVHSGASVNGYYVFNGDDPDADTYFALRFGPTVSAGVPFESHVDEWNLLGELGFQVLPGYFFLDVALQAGGTRAAMYEKVEGVEYRGVSDVATAVGVSLTLGANLF